MADNDVQLEQKKRSRRRLVGAVALALFAAIVLPMVMDSEPKPTGGELQIRIPGQEGSNFAQRIIAGNAPPPASPALPAAGQSVPVAVASVPAGSAPSSADADTGSVPDTAAVSASSSSASSRPREEKSAAAAQSSSSRASSSSKSSERSKPAVKDSERALDILEGKDKPDQKDRADAKDKDGAQKLYVQLGVFRDETNAREVLARANAAGVKAVAVRAEDKTRLRAGPFADRDAADAAVAKLKKADLNGIVVSK